MNELLRLAIGPVPFLYLESSGERPSSSGLSSSTGSKTSSDRQKQKVETRVTVRRA